MLIQLVKFLVMLCLVQVEALQCYNCTSGSYWPNPDCFFDPALNTPVPLSECEPTQKFCSVTYVLETEGETLVERRCSAVEEDKDIVEEINDFGYIIYFTCKQDGCNGEDKRVAVLFEGNSGNRSTGLPSFVSQLSLTLLAACYGVFAFF